MGEKGLRYIVYVSYLFSCVFAEKQRTHNHRRMSKKHFKYAAKKVVDILLEQNLGIQSFQHLDVYKHYVKFFTTFSKNFVEEKFNAYIRKNYKK